MGDVSLTAASTIGKVEQVVIPASMLQESSAVHQLSLSPDLSITSINALGQGSMYFAVNASHTVYNTDTVPVGRYALTFVIHVEGATSLSYSYLTIDVTPEGKLVCFVKTVKTQQNFTFFPTASQACELQLFGTCSQFCALDASTYGYSCFCVEGYILQQDNVTCLAFGMLSFCYYSRSMHGYIKGEKCSDKKCRQTVVNEPLCSYYSAYCVRI